MTSSLRSSTSYGAMTGDFEEDDFDIEEHNITTKQQQSQNAQKSNIWKPVVLSLGLLIVSFAALSISNYSNAGSTKSSVKLDATSQRITYAALSDYEKEALFRVFVDDFSKKYKTEEYQTKLEAFKAFLDLCDSRNMAEASNGGSAVHGVTQFSDLTPAEFSQYLGYTSATSVLDPVYYTPDTYTGSATLVDWTDVYTTPVKDQGYCGSCWAFSATEQIESDSIRVLGKTTSDTLSVQQIVSCDAVDGGCDGGNTEQAYQYVMDNKGLVSDTSYPYVSYYGSSSSCDSSLTDYEVEISNFATLKSGNMSEVETKMINYVMSTGPLSVCLDASTWSSYVSGVVSVCSDAIDHCVQVVGVNTGESYWKVRNSWGTSWGVDGFIYLQLNVNTCGITTDPTFTYPEFVGYESLTPEPSMEPTHEPTYAPTFAPSTASPTFSPTEAPTEAPTMGSSAPTEAPTEAPTFAPTEAPSISAVLSEAPTVSAAGSQAPTVSVEPMSEAPTVSAAGSQAPTVSVAPLSEAPTVSTPATQAPTVSVAPLSEAPTVSTPGSLAPTVSVEPVSAAPTMSISTTQAPTVSTAPLSEAPTVTVPATSEAPTPSSVPEESSSPTESPTVGSAAPTTSEVPEDASSASSSHKKSSSSSQSHGKKAKKSSSKSKGKSS